VHQMVGLLNKNGIYYAFDRTTISAGPLWQVQLATPATNLENNVSSSAWDGSQLYISAASTTINGSTCAGSLRALNPASGAFNWEDCLAADVLGPVTVVPGVAEVGSGTSFILIDTQTGNQLFSFQSRTP
jgi:outer membrane protein assembly factor BamB